MHWYHNNNHKSLFTSLWATELYIFLCKAYIVCESAALDGQGNTFEDYLGIYGKIRQAVNTSRPVPLQWNHQVLTTGFRVWICQKIGNRVLLTLLFSRASAECWSFDLKQLWHLLLLKMLGWNFLQREAAMSPPEILPVFGTHLCVNLVLRVSGNYINNRHGINVTTTYRCATHIHVYPDQLLVHLNPTGRTFPVTNSDELRGWTCSCVYQAPHWRDLESRPTFDLVFGWSY